MKIDLKAKKNQLELNISLPGNTHAKIDLSAIFRDISELTMNKEPIHHSNKSFEVLSGKYNIKVNGINEGLYKTPRIKSIRRTEGCMCDG